MLEKLLPLLADGPVAPSDPAKSGPLPSDELTSPLPDTLPEDPALTLCQMRTDQNIKNENGPRPLIIQKYHLTPLLLPTNGATRFSTEPLPLFVSLLLFDD